MKHTNVFKNAMMVLCAVFAFGLASSCEKDNPEVPKSTTLRDGDDGNLKGYLKQMSGGTVELISNEWTNNKWTIHVGRFDKDHKMINDTTVYRNLQEPVITIYPMETTYVNEKKMTHVSFGPNGTTGGDKYNDNGITDVCQNYLHNLDMKEKMELSISYQKGKLVIWGLTVESPAVNAKLEYNEKSIPLTPDGSDSSYDYYVGTMTYDLTVNSQKDKVQGRQRIGVAKSEIKVGLISNTRNNGRWEVVVGKFENGKHIPGSDTTVVRYLQDVNVDVYSQELTYVNEKKMTSSYFRKNGSNRSNYDQNGICKVTQNYLHDLDIKKDMPIKVSYEEGRLVIWGLTIESPAVNANLTYNEISIPLTPDGSDSNYEYYIGTMTYNLSVNGQNSSVQGRQRIAVKKSEIKVGLISNTRNNGRWEVVVGKFENGKHISGSDTTVVRYLQDVNVEVYRQELSDASSATMTSTYFRKNGSLNKGNYDQNGIRKVSQAYLHDLDIKKDMPLTLSYEEGRIVVWGLTVESPEINANLSYNQSSIGVTSDGSDSNYSYYVGRMNYTLTVNGQTSTVQGSQRIRVKKAEITVQLISNTRNNGRWTVVVGKYENGNHIPGSDTTVVRYLQDPYVEMYSRQTSSASEPKITSVWFRQNGGIDRTSYNQNGIRTASKAYLHDLDIRSNLPIKLLWEEGTMQVWGLTITSPDITANLTYTESQISVTADGSDSNYKYYLGTINYNLVVDGQTSNVQGYQRIQVKDEPETFTETIISKGLRRLSSSTAYVWALIRRTSSRGGYTEEEKGVNINFYGTPDGEEEFVVPFFDNPASKSLSVGPEQKGSSRPSGDFTITKYTRTATMKTENVSRNVVLTYEKPTLRLQKGNSYEYVDLPYVKYEDLVCQSVQTSSLINSMAGEQEWERKFYSYTLGATEKASETGTDFSNNPTTFVSNAVLKVAKDTPDDPRETPSWLGKPEWAKYTRVQSESGAKFEDMVVFGYTNGVVMAPKGVVDLKSGVFAYTDADASKHGVEKCAKGSCYSGVWTGSKWIPAKITESDGRWIYTGYGKSHTVMANNAINLGIGKDVTHTPKHQSYQITDNGSKITIHYSKNNASLSETDLISLK